MLTLIKEKKKVRVTIFILNRDNFRKREIIREKGGHCMMIMGIILQEDITIFNGYVANIRASVCVKQILKESRIMRRNR